MGILDNFEKGLERAVNGAFAKTFRSGLQPVEITSALKREVDTKAAVVSRERILAPNQFVVHMSASDYERMTAIGPALIDELTGLLQKHAKNQGYSFAGGISIRLKSDPSLSDGMLSVDSVNVKGAVSWTPVLDIGGKRHPLVKSRTIIGRGSDADITIDDSGTSRKHVEILWDGERAQARDLGSTNGSTLNGQPFSQAALDPDSVVQIGRTRIVFRVLAQASTRNSPAKLDDSTRAYEAGDGFWGPAR
ncbi:hypothetical protein L1277_003098 [Okibacterium sp. HSC-33S16]|uniref:FhaA domain-containing protein n=1 Tax=Okibacterium sp. HSC-33S16 TaxID=2910965 RepID=UPI00209D4900|nr:DUF3662 and FHA domain-containing protein [Okibacterium sp. HSC-33S16]MCP2032985.1 hypothetical protein [Okibacterium sp. HSC-33S16]